MNGMIGDILPLNKITGDITYGNGTGETVPIYNEKYEVTPLAFQQTILSTKNKKLIDDIVIKEVPYYETSNTSGGVTVYIAGDIEFE